MCGIVGAFAVGQTKTKAEERMQQESMIYISTQLLQTTVSRGEDATGVAMIFADGNYAGLKMGIPAPDFIAKMGENENEFGGQLRLWREYGKPVRIFMGHCRKASVGNSYDNKNNHPVKADDTFIVHNGTLTNHEKIFEKLGCEKTADVDSEAVARLVHRFTSNGSEPYSLDTVTEIVKRLHGTYAVIAASGNNPYQVALFRDTRPIEMVFVRPLKTMFVASEKSFLETVLFEYNKLGRLFLPTSRLPLITKEDVVFETLADDSLLVANLIHDVDEKTVLKDFTETKKGPWRTEKIWGAGTTTTVSTVPKTSTAVVPGLPPADEKKTTGPVHSNVTPATLPAVHTGSTKTSGSAEDDGSLVSGFIWNKALNTYKTEKGIEDTKKMDAVEIDVDTNRVTSLNGEVVSSYKRKEIVEETDAESVENLVSSPATIEEDEIKPKSVKTKEPAGFLRLVPRHEPVVSEVKTVDLSTNPEATVAAEKFIEDMGKYENEEEVLDSLQISDPSVFRNLPLHAVANRIAKFIAKTAFYLGFITAIEKSSCSTPATKTAVEHKVEDVKEKLTKAERKISSLKTITKILDKLAGPQLLNEVEDAVDQVVSSKAKAYRVSNTLNLFTVGDLKELDNVKQIKTVLEKKVGEEEDDQNV